MDSLRWLSEQVGPFEISGVRADSPFEVVVTLADEDDRSWRFGCGVKQEAPHMIARAWIVLHDDEPPGPVGRDEPLVRYVDHFFAALPDPEPAFNLLTKDLGLPVAWPYMKGKNWANGAVELGNARLELL